LAIACGFGSAAGKLAARASLARRIRDAARSGAGHTEGRLRRDRARSTPARRGGGERGRRRGGACCSSRAPRVRLGRPCGGPRRNRRASLLAAHRGAGARSLWSAQRVAELGPTFARELELLGVETAERAGAAERVATALSRSLADGHGRFVLAPHEEARSELRLTIRAGAALEHIRLDRTFVADGKRWIVDFKTSAHEGGGLDAFLDSEVARYAPQLERYAAAVVATDSRPVQLALYFPLLRELRAWPAAATAGRSG
jgi:hypothetical protein